MKKIKLIIFIFLIILILFLIQFFRYYSGKLKHDSRIHKEANEYIVENYDVLTPLQTFILSGGGNADYSEYEKYYNEYYENHKEEKFDNVFKFTYYDFFKK